MPDASIIPPMIVSGEHIKIPPGIYTTSKSTLSDYPNVMGPCGITVSDKSDFSIDARGVVLVQLDGANNANQLMITRCSRFRVDGLKIQPNPNGLPLGADPASLILVNILDFEFSNITIDGGQQVGTGIAGDCLARGCFNRVVMQSVNEGFDLAFVRQVRFRDCIGNGLHSSGKGAGQYGFINIEYDVIFSAAYPAAAQWLVSDDIVIDGCRAWNFSAGAFIRAGSSIRISNNDFSWNPSGWSNIGRGAGAGVYLFSETSGSVSSIEDPVQNVTIIGNIFVANGLSHNRAPLGAGVIIDASLPNAALISDIRLSGNLYNSNPTDYLTKGNVSRILTM